MPSSSVAEPWATIAAEAARESPLWAAALRPEDEREHEPVFSPLAEARFALGLETIYEGYLLHFGRPRLFAPADADTAILLGDYLYAHGLVRVAGFEEVEAVAAHASPSPSRPSAATCEQSEIRSARSATASTSSNPATRTSPCA